MKSKILFATLTGILLNELIYDFHWKGSILFLTFMIRSIFMIIKEIPIFVFNIL